ncbi:MAG: UDP-N-acetylmuramate--L-alanine ligase [Candidatus Rhabdochlamydia sp.]
MTHYHFIGIGGIGMSALARIVHERNVFVQGSEIKKTNLTHQLKEEGIDVFYPPEKKELKDEMTVIFGSAILEDHAEYLAAKRKNLTLLHRSDLLSQLMEGFTPLLVAGTHGKTSTAALLSHTLCTNGLNPSYALGGISLNTHKNGHHGKGSFFVAEADESDGTFCKYKGFGAIITNIEEEHLSFWKNKEALIQGFQQFAAQISDHLLFCCDDPILKDMPLKGMSYGFSVTADICITRFIQKEWQIEFDLTIQGKSYLNIELPLIGRHHALNGAAVFGLTLLMGIDEQGIRESFKQFKGVKRRMEKKGENKGVMIFDDYAHHPTEIQTTLQGLKQASEEKRVVAIFEPHRFSRFKHAWDAFLEAFTLVDYLIVTDVESAGELPIEGVTGELFADQLKQKVAIPVEFVKREHLLPFVGKLLRPHDVCITLGAGSITALSDELLHYPISPFSLFFIQGGRSAEHEVALLSAKMVKANLNEEFYKTAVWTISKEGKWYFNDQQKSVKEVVDALSHADLAFPLLHGPFGEDGMMQGFLEMIGIPYIGCDFRSGAVCMDKAWSKQIASSQGVFVAPFIPFTAGEWRGNKDLVKETILNRFTFPFYIKAVHLGSTFGVFKVKEEKDISNAIEEIIKLDYKFLVEEEVIGREMEFGFIGDQIVAVSQGAEVILKGEVHTYENKYSKTGSPAILKAPLPPLQALEGRVAAERVYRALGCSGLARIDFFLTSDGIWVFNEINPMPGLTPTSVYPAMWKAEGVSMTALIDRIVIASLHRHRMQHLHLQPPKKPPIDL